MKNKHERIELVIVYALYFFLNIFGAHRYYLGLKKSATAQLVCFWVGISNLAGGYSLMILGVWAVWIFFDLFYTYTLVKRLNKEQPEAEPIESKN